MLPKVMKWSEQQVNLSPKRARNAKNPTKIKNHTANLYTWGNGRQEIYLFGGYDGRTNHNDIHILDCKTLMWDTPPVHGDIPPGRNGHTATLARDQLFIQGGWLGRGPLAADDMYVFDILTKRDRVLHSGFILLGIALFIYFIDNNSPNKNYSNNMDIHTLQKLLKANLS